MPEFYIGVDNIRVVQYFFYLNADKYIEQGMERGVICKKVF